MNEIVVISGKGGTGKTTILSCFVALAGKSVIADCDVDAADLHLVLNPTTKSKQRFKSGKIPVVDSQKCISCLACLNNCRFDAIKINPSNYKPIFDLISCEGCGFCSRVCVVNAISMQENEVGDLFISDTKYGTFIHAKLGTAAENSGKLVSEVRKIAKEKATAENIELILSDGSPGIGCPVIASLTGVSMAVIVIEPTISGLHDGKRIIELCKHFKINIGVIINKYDLNKDLSLEIESYCLDNSIKMLGKIPFDESIVQSLVNGKIFVNDIQNDTSTEIKNIWFDINKQLERNL